MEKEMLERLTAMGVSEEDLQNPEKVKELAEKIETENKEKKESLEPEVEVKEDKILNDQLGRLRKALAKGQAPEVKAEVIHPTTLSELDVDNRVFIRTEKLDEKQVEILNQFSHLPKHEGKSFEDIFKSSAVQAELKELQAERDAQDEIDTNADETKLLETKNEIHEKYSKTGETPKTDYEHQVVVQKDLEKAGYREY